MIQEVITAPSYAQLLTMEELAQMLRISQATVFRLIRDKINPIPSMKIGHHRRFDFRLVQAWMKRQERVNS